MALGSTDDTGLMSCKVTNVEGRLGEANLLASSVLLPAMACSKKTSTPVGHQALARVVWAECSQRG
jgi:hypothetical protein